MGLGVKTASANSVGPQSNFMARSDTLLSLFPVRLLSTLHDCLQTDYRVSNIVVGVPNPHRVWESRSSADSRPNPLCRLAE